MDFNHLEKYAAARFYCEYKTWERIHRGIADPRLLAIPASWGRVADLNPNLGYFSYGLLRVTSLRRVVIPIVLCV